MVDVEPLVNRIRKAFPISKRDLLVEYQKLLQSLGKNREESNASLHLFEFKDALAIAKPDFAKSLTDEDICCLFVYFDQTRKGQIFANDFIGGLRGELSPARLAFVRELFCMIDKSDSGFLDEAKLTSFFRSSEHSNPNGDDTPIEPEAKSRILIGEICGEGEQKVSLHQFAYHFFPNSLTASSDEDFFLSVKEFLMVEDTVFETLRKPIPVQESTNDHHANDRPTIEVESSFADESSASPQKLAVPVPPSGPRSSGGKNGVSSHENRRGSTGVINHNNPKLHAKEGVLESESLPATRRSSTAHTTNIEARNTAHSITVAAAAAHLTSPVAPAQHSPASSNTTTPVARRRVSSIKSNAAANLAGLPMTLEAHDAENLATQVHSLHLPHEGSPSKHMYPSRTLSTQGTQTDVTFHPNDLDSVHFDVVQGAESASSAVSQEAQTQSTSPQLKTQNSVVDDVSSPTSTAAASQQQQEQHHGHDTQQIHDTDPPPAFSYSPRRSSLVIDPQRVEEELRALSERENARGVVVSGSSAARRRPSISSGASNADARGGAQHPVEQKSASRRGSKGASQVMPARGTTQEGHKVAVAEIPCSVHPFSTGSSDSGGGGGREGGGEAENNTASGKSTATAENGQSEGGGGGGEEGEFKLSRRLSMTRSWRAPGELLQHLPPELRMLPAASITNPEHDHDHDPARTENLLAGT